MFRPLSLFVAVAMSATGQFPPPSFVAGMEELVSTADTVAQIQAF
jgi:hypothetical protein